MESATVKKKKKKKRERETIVRIGKIAHLRETSQGGGGRKWFRMKRS